MPSVSPMPGVVPHTYSLGRLLRGRSWQAYADPFPHFVVQDVFTPEFYAELDRSFGALLGRGLAEGHDPYRFSRSIKNYDAYSVNFGQHIPAPLDIFRSDEWHDVLARVAGIEATGDVNGGFHHHLRGSRSGDVHNDLNPGWFLDVAGESRVNVSRDDLCSYSTGAASQPNLRTHETVRALAVLFFLHNTPWRPGDGGETGLYTTRYQPIAQPTKAIAPVNNTLMMFECRPNSYHGFISNERGPRNSMIMWLHRPKRDAIERWGEDAIIYWK